MQKSRSCSSVGLLLLRERLSQAVLRERERVLNMEGEFCGGLASNPPG